MSQTDRAKAVLCHSVEAAKGYLELASLADFLGMDSTKMKESAIEELQRFSNDDDLIDAMYDEYLKQMEKEDGQ